MRSASWRRRRSPAGRRPGCARRCSRRRPRSSARRSCATSPRTSRWRRVRAPIDGCVAYAPAGDGGAGSTDISPMAPVLCWPTDRRRCRPTCRASAAACCTRRRRCSPPGFGAVCLVNSDSPDPADRACWSQAARRAAGARRADRAWSGRGWRLLPAGHEAAARASVRRHRLEHGQRRGRRRARAQRRSASRWSRCRPGTTSTMRHRWPDWSLRPRTARTDCSLRGAGDQRVDRTQRIAQSA